MNKQILKYELDEGVTTTPGGKVVLVDQQHGRQLPTVWIEASLDDLQQSHEFRVIGTGHPFDDHDAEHVGSCVCAPFVWHVYRRTK